MNRDLLGLEVLSHFSESQLGQLSGCGEMRGYGPGERLFQEGDSSSEVYLLRRGRVRVHRATSYGEFELGQLGDGNLLGEQSFLDRTPRGSSVETVEASDLFVIDPPSLAAVTAIDPAFQQAVYWSFWKSLSAKLRGANQRLFDFFEVPESDGDPADLLSLPAEPSSSLDLKAKMSVFEERRLSGMEINFLSSLSREERYLPGQRIFSQGDPGDRMFVVVEGQVVISTMVAGAGEEALCFLGRGDFFGEMALIDGKPRSAAARSHPKEGALVLAIPKEVVEGLLDAHRVSSISLLSLLCRMVSKRLRAIDDKLVGWYLVVAADPEARPEIATRH
ncbi:MAG: cyclic nucleotide-binding domain-containing protein [Thermoanaerobaculia bacterium]|nr:cyclic nucleotide-binding domain-containing protein [Thermoanaerobaculia bacterium]